MGQPGRPVLPEKIKKLSGTMRKDRERGQSPFKLITIIPKPESWLDIKAKKYFINTCKLLIEKKLLDDGNIQLVALMSQEYARYEKAQRELKKTGEVIEMGKNKYKAPSPWVAISNQSLKNFREIASLFGLDPVNSRKIVGVKAENSDPFEELMQKYASQ